MSRVFQKTTQHVKNRGQPPGSFLNELVDWGRAEDPTIFAPNANSDVYSSVRNVLAPNGWESPLHRKAAMLEVMRVLGGFESSWDWTEGVDTTNSTSVTPYTIEAGLWQVSANAMYYGEDLKKLVLEKVGTLDGDAFQAAMKHDHLLAMEFIARLLRHTVRHNGPVLRHDVDPWLRRDAVKEFEGFLA